MAADQLPDPETPFGKSVRERLASEPLIWLTTVGKDGTPQPNPVWFLLDGDDILIYNVASANRLVHIRERPRVSLNFNADDNGGSIVVITGLARVAPDEQPPNVHPGYVAKYANPMANVSGSADKFAATYNVAMRIDIGKVRGF
ncbi:MAG TPA: TIGR03667 family PPOX class F420-dependent oxidoreductase [Pseudonocardiaceae bacterium]|nr:TIGR03667 family PPOX class F420-dependent oxidoreductase [Pseudonocardiaceae bacterium]